MITVQETITRLLLALILGGLIGWERETHERPAGFRTHILVSIGSALLMMISIKMAETYPETRADPGRIAAQVVSGIGFLGAGTILREGLTVKGLTTAASLWSIAAIGLAVGAGYYYPGVITTGIVIITLIFLNKLEYVKGIENRKQLTCRLINSPGVLGHLGVILGSQDINIENIRLDRSDDEGQVIAELELTLPKRYEMQEINERIMELEELVELNWQGK